MDGKAPHLLLDVRDDYEREVSALPNSLHLPLGQLIANAEGLEVDRETKIIIYCRSGKRSQTACAFLSQNGFTDVSNLTGGITAWKHEIQPDLPVA